MRHCCEAADRILGPPPRYGSVRVRANIVAVGVVAAAAAVVGPCSSGADRSGTDRSSTDTVAAIAAAIAVGSPAAHCDSTAPISPNCDCATTVADSTAPIAATSATASIGIIGDQAGGEQNECCNSSENVSEHNRNLLVNSLRHESLRRLSARRLM